ncbi:B1 protein [Danaus plexippus plexippus]|uniref:B1 protein n=1 Tax=Danaus plexippus plexippus TaxID=278856 RepID=A0A212FCS1_DANPL|nr:B1 protein [Danaus plexippus plexippus]
MCYWISTTGRDSEDDVVRILPSDVYKTNDEYRHIWSPVHGDAVVFVRPLLFHRLVVVLLQVSLQLSQDDMLTLLVVLLLHQVTTESKSFMPLGKAERAMFLSHSEACLEQSGAERAQVERLVGGAPEDSPALRRHVLCVLRRCKLLRKDGRLDKHALRDRISASNDTKILEGCSDQSGDTPEDLAWHLFRCGLNKKVLFEHMTAAAPNEA